MRTKVACSPPPCVILRSRLYPALSLRTAFPTFTLTPTLHASLHSAQIDTEAFDEGFDRHIWSLADQSLRWDLQIGRERRTKPEELERQMRELLASQGELDAEEATALEEVADESVDAPPKEDRTCISLRPAPRRND